MSGYWFGENSVAMVATTAWGAAVRSAGQEAPLCADRALGGSGVRGRAFPILIEGLERPDLEARLRRVRVQVFEVLRLICGAAHGLALSAAPRPTRFTAALRLGDAVLLHLGQHLVMRRCKASCRRRDRLTFPERVRLPDDVVDCLEQRGRCSQPQRVRLGSVHLDVLREPCARVLNVTDQVLLGENQIPLRFVHAQQVFVADEHRLD